MYRGSGAGSLVQTLNSGRQTWRPALLRAFLGGDHWCGRRRRFSMALQAIRVVRGHKSFRRLSLDSDTYQDSAWRAKRGSPALPPSAAVRPRHSRRGCCRGGPQPRPRPGKETSPIEPPLFGDKARCVTGGRCGLAIKIMLGVGEICRVLHLVHLCWTRQCVDGVWVMGAWPLRVRQESMLGPRSSCGFVIN